MDAFIGLYDTVVRDRRLLSPRNPLACLLRRMEWLALHLADGVMVDTDEHARALAADYRLSPGHVFPVPVGIDERVWQRLPLPPEEGVFRVALWTTFIPLHGVEFVAQAAKIAADAGRPIRFEIVGDGQTADRFAAALAALAPDNVLWRRGFLEMDELVALAGRSHCCLGIMGTSDKAARVVPYKVYQALAAGRPVITADTAAARGVLVDGENALLVPPGDAQALAHAIVRLAGDRQLCERLAEGARAAYEEHLSERVLARALDRELTRIVERWQRSQGGRAE
jgi:glycosyltransferase involved in cell wall biosynthesis